MASTTVMPGADERRALARERRRMPPRTPAERIRRSAFRRAKINSFIVRSLRYGLPTLSVALVGVMMLSGTLLDESLPSVSVESVGIDGSTLTMVKPTINGFEPGNGRYMLEADKAVQQIGALNVVEVEGLEGRMEQEDGRWATIRAAHGVIDTDKRVATLQDNIVVRADGGYRALLKSAQVNMQEGDVQSSEPVQVDLLNGKLTADTLELVDRGRYILFDGRVRMTIYLGPGSEELLSNRAPANEAREEGE